MKNKYLLRQSFNNFTESLASSLHDMAQSNHLTDDEVYEMTILLIKSYINVVVPTKGEN